MIQQRKYTCIIPYINIKYLWVYECIYIWVCLFIGEVVELSKNGVKSVYIAPRPNNNPPAMCIFEYVYFARPDSIFEGEL